MDNSKELPNIRIRKVKLTNFRNIEYAEIDIPNSKLSNYINGDSSVLGIYGQNGSGKTTFLIALKALKTALSGGVFFYPQYASCIKAGCESAMLEFEFSAYNDRGDEFEFYYSFKMSETNDGTGAGFDKSEIDDAFDYYGYGEYFSDKARSGLFDVMVPKDKKIVISDEVLQFACKLQDGRTYNKQILIDTSVDACKNTGRQFGNKKKYEQLTYSYEGDIDDQLYRIKILASIESTSYIFRFEFLKAISKGCKESLYIIILESLWRFGRDYLFVRLMDDVNRNDWFATMTLATWTNDKEYGARAREYPLLLIDHTKLPEEDYEEQKEAIASISRVLSSIVPGLAIEIEDYGQFRGEKGNMLHSFDLVSIRNGVRIPLRFESDGIKRFISFLSLLIAAYNEPSVTVAVDEIDSGIFEYMLGELLNMMKESARGQLIFTSHNLRPLETLSYSNLLFTTINPCNRFVKLEGISGNNNLRDRYYRNIMLGNGENALYSSTDSFSIEQAMIEAGHSQEK